MNISPEEKFYSSSLRFSPVIEPSQATEKAFAQGMRYAIVDASLSREPSAASASIVELGCGSGEKLLYLQRKYKYQKAVGIDLCFAGHHTEGDDHEFFAANLNQPWPLADGSVDTLIAMMLLEHLFDPFASFREIKRTLTPSGRAFINLPLVTSVKNRIRLLLGKIPVTSVPYSQWQEEGHWDGFHLHYFTIASLRDLARYSGMTIYGMQSVGRLHSLKNLWPQLLCDEISVELRHQR